MNHELKYDGQTDEQLLAPVMQEKDRGADYLRPNNYYGWYFGIGRKRRPKIIGEIGIRFGYSLYAMALGAGTQPILFGMDLESYEPGCLTIARQNLEAVSAGVRLMAGDSQGISPGASNYRADLFHVDGDHSVPGCRHDLDLAWAWTTSDAWILVDDVDLFGELKPLCVDYAKEKGVTPFYLPTVRGMMVLPKGGV